jgi:hypothetical protein
MNWKTFFKGLGMAAAGGATTAILDGLSSGNFSGASVKMAGIGGAAVAVAAYLKQSPIKPPAQPSSKK